MLFDDFATTIRPQFLARAFRLGVGDAAEDVVQETFMVLLTRYSHLDETDWVGTVFRTCWNKAQETLRENMTPIRAPLSGLGFTEFGLPPSTKWIPARIRWRIYINNEMRDRMRAANRRGLEPQPCDSDFVKHRCIQALLKECST